MTVAVAANFPDGVVLGVDSAVTINNANGQVVKIYENAEKLFQIGEKPIGIAGFGLAILGGRGIGSYLREFEVNNPSNIISKPASIQDVVEEIRKFFMQIYRTIVIPELEAQKGKKFEEFEAKEKPVLGLAVAGYSGSSPFSEVWEILIPINETPYSAKQWCKPKEFRCAWFALNEPIYRYTKGYDRDLLVELKKYVGNLRGTPLNPSEVQAIDAIVAKYEYPFPCSVMPLREGIAFVRFQVELVINHHRFSVGAPIVGGDARIGVVTYKGEKFRILEEVL
jgi:hypothetical protein